MIRRHLIVATYCWRISLVSAPGWRRRLRFLNEGVGCQLRLGCQNYLNKDDAYDFRKELTRLAR
jgi:hypothetical protein